MEKKVKGPDLEADRTIQWDTHRNPGIGVEEGRA